jgi:Spy/CpxP family protein refolding chaperone
MLRKNRSARSAYLLKRSGCAEPKPSVQSPGFLNANGTNPPGCRSISGRVHAQPARAQKKNGGNMKKISLVAAVALSMCLFAAQISHAQAQGNGDKAQKLEKLEALSKQLNLTPEQKVKLFPILKAEAPKLQAIKDNTSLTGMQKLEQIRALHEQTAPEVKAILTPAQYEQLQTIRQQEIQEMIRKKRAAQ